MAYSRCTGMGTGQVQVMGPELMGSNILYRNVHTGLRLGQEPDRLSPIVPVPHPVPAPVPVLCSVNDCSYRDWTVESET